MKLDADIRQVAEAAQVRRRAAAERVKRGELQHLNFMELEDCYQKADENLEQIIAHTGNDAEMVPARIDSAAVGALADVLNYGLAVIAKSPEAAEPE